MLSVEQAAARTRALITPMPAEQVELGAAAGRVLAAPVVADRDLPGVDNSAMDGFACRSADLPGTLPVTGLVAAGQQPAPLAAGHAVRIMTGAPVPDGADTVVIFEDSHDHGDTVELPGSPPGANLRRAGEDLASGAAVLAAGVRIGWAEVGVLAALGHARVAVARRPVVAIVATGDELVDVATPPGPGQVVDSSAHALAVQIAEAGGVPRYLGIAPDRLDATTALIEQALACDVVVTTGGVSVGDRDHVRAALTAAGVDLEFWKVAMKPGKPLAAGRAGPVVVFGLPGNPVSTVVAFELFVRPALLAMQGAAVVDRPRVPVAVAGGYHKKAGRTHFVRARIARDGQRLVATPNRQQGSHMLSSLLDLDGLIEVAADLEELADGAVAPARLLRAV